MGEGFLHPFDSGHKAGEHIAQEEEKARLDAMMGDDEGAAGHRGDAYGGIAAAIVTKGALKGITKLRGGRVRIELEGGKSVEVPESVAYDNKGIYDPKAVKAYLEEKYETKNVSSSTIPSKPKQASSSREDVITDEHGNKAVKVELDDGTIKYIPYDDRALPIFDDVATYTTTIEKPANYENMSEKARRAAEMRAATRQLREDIENGKVDASMFTEQQMDKIRAGSSKIPDYTWHHNGQSAPNNMQLVPDKIHNELVPHTGEGSMSR